MLVASYTTNREAMLSTSVAPLPLRETNRPTYLFILLHVYIAHNS